MAGRRRRTTGAFLVVVGLMLTITGFIVAPAAAAEEPPATVDICNNQKGGKHADQDCAGDNKHGTVTWSFEEDGDLKFELAAVGDYEWKDIYICIPGSEKSNRADCQGNTGAVLSPTVYTVTGPDDIVEGDKGVSFDCAPALTATVDAAAIAQYAGAITWTIHVNSCSGTTDEAFGSSTRPTSGETPTYGCAAPTNVTTTSATLNAETTDETVTSVKFTLGSTEKTDSSVVSGKASVDVDGLAPNTVYTYDVAFLAGTETVETAEDCQLATRAVAPTYACAPATNVTFKSATLHGTTTDGDVTSAEFTLSDGTKVSDSQGDSRAFSADVDGLKKDTSYSYTVTFKAGSDVRETSSACQFATSDTPPDNPPVNNPESAAVLGVQVSREAPAAPAVADATLATTGTSDVSTTLVLFGIALLVIGGTLLVASQRVWVRPIGNHSSQ